MATTKPKPRAKPTPAEQAAAEIFERLQHAEQRLSAIIQEHPTAEATQLASLIVDTDYGLFVSIGWITHDGRGEEQRGLLKRQFARRLAVERWLPQAGGLDKASATLAELQESVPPAVAELQSKVDALQTEIARHQKQLRDSENAVRAIDDARHHLRKLAPRHCSDRHARRLQRIAIELNPPLAAAKSELQLARSVAELAARDTSNRELIDFAARHGMTRRGHNRVDQMVDADKWQRFVDDYTRQLPELQSLVERLEAERSAARKLAEEELDYYLQ